MRQKKKGCGNFSFSLLPTTTLFLFIFFNAFKSFVCKNAALISLFPFFNSFFFFFYKQCLQTVVWRILPTIIFQPNQKEFVFLFCLPYTFQSRTSAYQLLSQSMCVSVRVCSCACNLLPMLSIWWKRHLIVIVKPEVVTSTLKPDVVQIVLSILIFVYAHARSTFALSWCSTIGKNIANTSEYYLSSLAG